MPASATPVRKFDFMVTAMKVATKATVKAEGSLDTWQLVVAGVAELVAAGTPMPLLGTRAVGRGNGHDGQLDPDQ